MLKTYLIWDLPLRLFHWLLVITLIAAYITGTLSGLWLEWHTHFGVFILSLIVFRITWGFIGSTYSRFSSFYPSTHRLKTFLASPQAKIGHSRLGALSIFAMLGLITTQAIFGLFALNDEIDIHGPLYALLSSSWSERLTLWHSQVINVLLLLAGLHVIAIGYYSWFKKCTLITPMITGKIKVADKFRIEPVNGGGKIALFISFGLAGLVFFILENEASLDWLIKYLD